MTPDTSAQSPLGTIEEVGDRHVLRYERRLSHPVDRVWRMLTEPSELAQWLAAADELELVEGGPIALRWLNTPDDTAEWEEAGVEIPEGHDVAAPARGQITELDPPHLIEYETDLTGRMRWELRADGDATVLTFTNTIELPPDHPAVQTLAGWHIHLDHLDAALVGNPVHWATWTADHIDDFGAIRARYETHP